MLWENAPAAELAQTRGGSCTYFQRLIIEGGKPGPAPLTPGEGGDVTARPRPFNSDAGLVEAPSPHEPKDITCLPHGTPAGNGKVSLHLLQYLLPHRAPHLFKEAGALPLLPGGLLLLRSLSTPLLPLRGHQA